MSWPRRFILAVASCFVITLVATAIMAVFGWESPPFNGGTATLGTSCILCWRVFDYWMSRKD